ncbi:MAG TPA: hypothetical protein VHZ76_00960 [Gammaproteobacteria bacterium]|jgi:hypothetical protein|nr:hypothetical protein [Gammaproteobacteria bacterium]
MSNILQAVQTYQSSALGILENLYCFINTANKRFKDFNTMTRNLGDTVTFDLPPRMVANLGSLVVSNFEAVQQRVQTLTVGGADAFGTVQAATVPFAFTAQELIFNIDNNDYREKLELAAMSELGAVIEGNVAKTILTSPYRFYGDGVTPINSFGQLAQGLANFRDFGSVSYMTRGYLSNLAIPGVVNSGLQQFALNRNNELANSWELGEFDNCEWYQSNLLPIQNAGNIGQNGTVVTVVSIDSTGTLLTVSGAGTSDANAIKANDLLQFQDNVSGQTNIRYLTFTGHQVSGSPVQVRATANAASTSGGQVTISVYPPLISTQGDLNQNISTQITSGMQLKALPSHRAGMIISGDAFFIGMPQLPDQEPFPTANKADQDSGAAIRFTYGSTFGQNQTGFIYDAIWGATIVPEYAMRVVFPL